MNIATEVGYKKIPGADHSHPAYHYKLTPGKAWLVGAAGNEVVDVDDKLAKRAGYTFCLQWISGRTVALFECEGLTYGQPITEGPAPKGKRKKEIVKEAGDIYPVKGTGPKTAPIKNDQPVPAQPPPPKKTIKSQPVAPPKEEPGRSAPRRVKGQRRLKAPLSLLDF